MATIIKLSNVGREVGERRESGGNQFNLAFPLSAAQERVWREDQQNPGDAAYNCAFRWRLEGPLDVSILEQALNVILARHEVLRATFTKIGVDPVQLIAPSATLKIAFDDVRSIADVARKDRIEAICREEAVLGFDIEAGPLVRARIIQVEEQQHYLLLTLHLLIADGWSIRVIMGELQTLYGALVEGRESLLPDLLVQYPDYVIWQREGASDKERVKQLAYWKSKLAGYRRLEVPGDLVPPDKPDRASDIVSFELPRELTDRLNELSTRFGGTMFVTVLAACNVLLNRYAGVTDIALGSELAGRNRTELEGLVGLFINHVIFRADLAGNPRFVELAEQIRNTTWEIFANQNVPFEQVVDARRAEGELDPDPFFLVNFNCYRAYGGSSNSVWHPTNIHVTPVPSVSQGALYRLNIFMIERESGWRLSIDYNKNCYTQQFATQMLESFVRLLEEVAADPQRPISEFDLSVGAPCEPNRPSDTTAEPAVGEPASDERYTLPASVVQERFWLLAKLDPTSPKFHMRATVRLTGSLSEEMLGRSFQELVDRHEILRTTFAEQDGGLVQIMAASQEFDLSVVSLLQTNQADLEGKLKALLHEEARHPFDLQKGPLFRACLFLLRPGDAVLLITTHHIIADGWSQRVMQNELWSIYEALTEGRLPSLAPSQIQFADFAAWQKEWLSSAQANAHLDYWLKQLGATPLKVIDFPTDRAPALRMSSQGGIESFAVPCDLMEELRKLGKSEGVTMFTLTLACFAILISRCSKQEDILVGSPVANRKPEIEPLIGPFAGPIAFRFDLAGNPSLREVLRRVSEVSLEGLDHSDLPFEALLQQLLVPSVKGRTALFQFYFLYQAAFLRSHLLPGLTIAPMPSFSVGTPFELQLAMIERPDEVRVNFEYDAELFDRDSIRALLRYYERVLRTLVSDPDMKVDNLAAPAIGKTFQNESKAPTEPKRAQVAPQTEDQIKLAEIWQNILKIPFIGVHDNFFELGGHSLLAAQLVSQVKARFGITIDLSLLIVAPTIDQLAVKLRQSLEKDRLHIVAIRTSGIKPPLFCIHGGGGHLLDYRDMIAALPEDQPIYGLRAGDVNEAFPETVEELADQYLLEIQSVQSVGPYQICGLSFGGLVAYEIARKLAEKGENVGLVALFDTGNWAYYRNLSAEKLAHFRRTYTIDRLKKYGRNLIQGRFDDLASDARQFFTSRWNALLWKISMRICRMIGVSVPRFVRSNIVVFSAMGKNYDPGTYPGRLLLFRAEGRTAEYGEDLTLGWTAVAQEGVVVHQVPGSHLSIMRKPHVDRLVELLAPHLVN